MKRLFFILLLFLGSISYAQQPPTACFKGDSINPCTIDFTDLSLGNPTAWAWTFSGGTPGTSTIQNPTITYNTPGTYNVWLIVTNAFGNDDEIKMMNATICYLDTTTGTPCTLTTGLENLVILNESINVYPNPTTGIFTVQGATGKIQVYDLLGNLVLHTNKREIDMGSYPAGIYFVRAGEAVRKLILH